MAHLLADVVFCLGLLAAGITSVIPPSCPSPGQVAWKNTMPYLYHDGIVNTNDSILPAVLRSMLRNCCRGDVNMNYSVKFSHQLELIDLIKNHSVHFIMPVHREEKSNKYFHYPYIPVVESPGIAMYIQKQPSTGEVIINAISSAWPFVAMMFVLVAMSGCMFCLIEMITLKLTNRPTQKFIDAFWGGLWWAFVSMTTVGYGDICPKTKPGRIFSILWVITGVAFCALFTSYMTTILTSSCMSDTITLSGSKVGVLIGSEEQRYALKKNAIAKEFSSVSSMVRGLEEEEVDAILIETYVAGQHKEKLDDLQLQGIIEHITTTGIAFLNDGVQYAQCIRDYVYSHQGDISKLISENVKFIEIRQTSNAEEKSKNLINTSSKGFIISIAASLSIFAALVIIGVTWDNCLRRRRKKYGNIKDGENEITLSEWKYRYKIDFQTILEEMAMEADMLSENCNSILSSIMSRGIVTRKKEVSTSMHYGYKDQ